MVFIILGVIVLLIGRSFLAKNPQFGKSQSVVYFSAGVLFLLGLSTSVFKMIDAGQVGVQSMFGKVNQATLPSGLNVINPLMDVTLFDIKTQNYTMSGVHDEGDKSGDDAIRVLTADGLEVVVDLTVLFKILPSEAPRILQEIGPNYLDKIVRPITRTKIRDNAVYYDAISLYSTKRDEFQSRIYNSIASDFKKRGLVLEQLLVRNITLPVSVKVTIESKINAEQDAQKMQFVLQKEKQ